MDIRLETFWISRDTEQIEYCDKVSKEVDTSYYWISDEDFWWLQREFELFHADYFAWNRSGRMKPYFTRFSCGESEGVDALLLAGMKEWDIFTCRWA